MLVTDIRVTRPAPGVGIIHVPAEFDVYTAPGIRQVQVDLVHEGVRSLVFELTDTQHIDSTGLGVLVGAMKRLHAVGGAIVLDSPQPNVRHVLGFTGMTKIFQIVEPVIVGSEA